MSTKRFNSLVLALLGAFLGMGIFFSPGATFILTLVFLTCLFLRRLSSEDKRFILFLFVIGVGARILVTYFLHIFSSYQGFPEAYLFRDGMDNSIRGWMVTQYWLGDMSNYSTLTYGYNMHGWTYLAGFFYLLFGHSPLGLKFINCLLSVLTGIIIYFIAKEIFSSKVGKLSAIFTVFFPSLFLWSLSNLKETSVIFLISATLWSFIKFQKERKVYYLIFLILALYFSVTLRPELGLCMIFTVVFSYFCISKISLIKKIGICLIALLTLHGFLFVKDKNLKSITSEKLAAIVGLHQGIVTTGGSVYKLLDEKYYLTNFERTAEHQGSYFRSDADMKLRDYANMFFKGWAHFLLEPFLWRIPTKRMLFSYPQVVLWYILIPFAFLGMILAARYNWRFSLILFMHFFVIGSLLAMSEGNIGTLFRHRDMLTPLFLIFASLGLIKIFGQLDISKQ